MSICEFHAQLASNDKNPLFNALRKLSTLADPNNLFDDPTDGTTSDWPIWGETSGSSVQPA
jgi:hypothetical protein